MIAIAGKEPRMKHTYTLAPIPNCPFCHGGGTVSNNVLLGEATYTEIFYCDCVTSQLPEEFNPYMDEVVIMTQQAIKD